MLKGFSNERATILYALSTTNTTSSCSLLIELCKTLIDAYIKAIERSGFGSAYMQTGTTNEANTSLAVHLTRNIPEEKDGGLSVDDVETWMRKEVLVTRLLEDVFKACFLGGETIVDMHRHGLQEGCEPTVERQSKRYRAWIIVIRLRGYTTCLLIRFRIRNCLKSQSVAEQTV